MHVLPWQLCPQAPQLAGSVSVLRHVLLQSDSPASGVHWHIPPMQLRLAPHALLHWPQLRGSTFVFVQAPAQYDWPSSQPPSVIASSGASAGAESPPASGIPVVESSCGATYVSRIPESGCVTIPESSVESSPGCELPEEQLAAAIAAIEPIAPAPAARSHTRTAAIR
jgi:hypothetical protein